MAILIQKPGVSGFTIAPNGSISGIPAGATVRLATLNLSTALLIHTAPTFTTTELILTPPPVTLDGSPYMQDGTAGVDGYVYPLAGSAQLNSFSRPILFAGTSPAANNGRTVQARLVGHDSGVAWTDWTNIGTVSAGAFSGSITCPATSELCHRDVRFADDHNIVFREQKRCAVGIAVLVDGQSNTSMPLYSFSRPTETTWAGSGPIAEPAPYVDLEEPGLVSVITMAGQSAGSAGAADAASLRYMQVQPGNGPAGQMTARHDTFKKISNQWRRLCDFHGWPRLRLCLITKAHNTNAETSPVVIHGYHPTPAQIQGLIGAGEKISFAVGHTLLGGDTKQDGSAHGYVGYTGHISPVTTGAQYTSNINNFMAQSSFASPGTPFLATALVRGQSGGDEDIIKAESSQVRDGVAPVPFPHMRGADQKPNAHTMPGDKMGAVHLATIYPLSIARLLSHARGETEAKNPYFDAPMFNQDRSAIRVSIVPQNGGDIWSPAPGDLANWTVFDGGGTTESLTGFSAFLSGNYVYLVKDSGTWLAGTRIQRKIYGHSTGGDPVVETRMVYHNVFERWAGDLDGFGIAVQGTYDDANDRWRPLLEEAPAAYAPANEEFPTKASLETYLGTAGTVGRVSQEPLKVPGVNAMPAGMSVSGTTITISSNIEAMLEDWDFRGFTIFSAGSSVKGFRNCLFNDIGVPDRRNYILRFAEGNGFDLIENCEFVGGDTFTNANGAINCYGTNFAVAKRQFVLRRCLIRGYVSDFYVGPVGLIERNIFDYRQSWPTTLPAWAAGTTYALGAIVKYAGFYHISRIAGNVGNTPSNADHVDTASWYQVHPHLDMITANGCVGAGTIQYNAIRMQGVAGSEEVHGVNNYVRCDVNNTQAENWTRRLIVRRNVLTRKTTETSVCFEIDNSQVTGPYWRIEGNWLNTSGGGLLHSNDSAADLQWGENWNYATDAVLTRPTNSVAWP